MPQPVLRTDRLLLVPLADRHFDLEAELDSDPEVLRHVGDMLRGFDTLRELAESDEHVIPGHDPEVRTRYPAVGEGNDDIVALHRAPRGPTDAR